MAWIRKGQIAVAGDVTTSALIRKSGSLSQNAVDSRVKPAVTSALQDNPTIVAGATAAAVTAVEQALTDASVVRGALDGGFMSVEGVPVAGGLTDVQGRFTPFVWTPEGRVHPASARMLAQDVAGIYESGSRGWAHRATDEAGRVLYGVRSDGVFVTPGDELLRDGFVAQAAGSSVLVHDLDKGRTAMIDAGGTVTDVPRIVAKRAVVFTVGGTLRWGRVTGGPSYPFAADMTAWAGFGSSTMAGFADEMSAFAASKGASWYDGGYGGEGIEQTLARLGVRPVVTTGFVIPTSTTPVDAPINMPSDYPGSCQFVVSVLGVEGTLSKGQGVGQPWRFTRTSAGTSTAVPSGAVLVPTIGPTKRGNLMLLNLAKNNITRASGGTASVAEMITGTADAVNYLTALDHRFLIIGHWVDRDVPAGAVERALIREYNDACRDIAGDRFIDVQTAITSPDLWTRTGITPTAQDIAAQVAGNKPPSVSADSLHLNAAGYAWLRGLVADKMTTLGWV